MIAAVFPGQGSQKPGMGLELWEKHSEARAVFDEVSKALSLDLRKLCFETDEETLRQTQNAQIALFTCSVAAFHCLTPELRERIKAMAGHSVGEYAALTCAGIYDIPTGAQLVRRRGELMAASGQNTPGTMAAILGLERETLEDLCKSTAGTVVIANDNCPGQLVISGEVEAVKAAGEAASAAGAKRVLPLNVSGAFHSPLMDNPAQEMAKTLAENPPLQGRGVKVYSNVGAEPVDDTRLWPTLLEAQLRSPVRWTETIQNLIRDGVTSFVECGVGDVLSGLMRRIDKGASTNRVSDESSLANTLHDLG
ncbi:MAG: ACP S-malonyltransferase [Fimbriimonas sp.]